MALVLEFVEGPTSSSVSAPSARFFSTPCTAILSPGPKLQLRGDLPVRRTAMDTSARTRERPGASLEEIESAHIVRVLEECDWRVRGKDGAAERLGLKRSTLQSRMKKLGIRRPTGRSPRDAVEDSSDRHPWEVVE